MSWHTRFSHSKIVCLGFSIFDPILPLLKIIFCLTKSIDPNTLKRHNYVRKNWPGNEFFKLRKSNFWERQFFLIVTLKV